MLLREAPDKKHNIRGENMKIRKYLILSAFFSICGLTTFLPAGCKAPEIVSDVKTGSKPWTHLNFYNNPDNFQFAVLADRTGGIRRGIFPEAVKKLNLLRPEFVICIGDLIPGYTKEPKKIMAEWSEFNALVDKFKMPFFYVSGNHDISNKEMADLWEKLFGRSYYYFIYKHVLFICLDSQDTPGRVYESPGRYLSDEQIAWAKKTLKEHPEPRWTCIFMHQPLWLYNQDTGFKEIEDALAGRNYTVFAGHFHQYTKYIRNGKKYFILATTGGGSALRGPAFGEFDETVWVTMTDHGPLIANLRTDGILSEDVLTEKKLLEIRKNAAFLKKVKFKLNELESSAGKLSFSLCLRNDFKCRLKYDLNWETLQSPWQTSPKKAEGFIEPGKEKVLHFKAKARAKTCIPAICKAKFHVENDLDIKTELNTKKLLVRAAQPAAEAVFTDEKPEIDGKFDDAVWGKTKMIMPFLTMHGEAASAATSVRLSYDRNNLYFAFKCSEPDIRNIRDKVKKHDGPVWEDDSVEILLDTNKDKKSYYHIIVNSSAVIYDSFVNKRNHKKEYEINPQAAVKVSNDSWTLEMAVPWEKIGAGAPRQGQEMALLLVRTRARKNEIMQYPVMFGGNLQPGKFGNLKFK
jgi:hypothetical protein